MTPEYLFEFLEEPIDFMGFDLVEVHVLGSKPPTLQIMIERKDRKNVTIKDCEKVSRSLSTLIDVGDIIPEQYTLEISSPGIERQLNKLQDYQRFTGNDALVELRVPINNKKKIRCNIRGVREDDNIEIFCLDEINSGKNLINVSFQNIERAKLLAPYS